MDKLRRDETPKQGALRVIRKLPDDVTYEAMIYHLGVMEAIDAGLRDIEQGNVVSHEQVKREVEEWLKSVGQPMQGETS